MAELSDVERKHARGRYPLHPFLFAIASVLALLASDLNEAAFPDALPALAGAVLFAGALYLLAALARRRFDAGAAIIASIWVVGCLYYGDLFATLNRWLDGGYSMVATLPVALAAMGLATWLAWRFSAWLRPLHIVLNAIAVVLVITPLWQAGAYEWKNFAARDAYDADRAAAAMPQIAPAAIETSNVATAGRRPPDIYHFIFDRYARADVLAHEFGVDGSAVTGFLENAGFYVTTDSYANYPKTGPSLASTFYLNYLDNLADAPGLAGSNWHPIFEMLDDHRVGRFLKARGYEFLQFGSWWDGTSYNPAADENHPHGFTEFNMLYLRGTVLKPLFHILPDTPLTMRLDWDNGQCQRVADQLRKIKALGQREKPVYVFAHILVPHGPYVFAPDGRCLTQEERAERTDLQGYVNQVAYAGKIIRDMVRALQDRPEKPVIIIQADEGPFPDREERAPWQEAPPRELRIKTAILNAYYFPEGDYRQLYPEISPVNSYRVLFNTLFGTDFELLDDRVYVFPNGGKLYEYYDVTEKLRTAPPLEGEIVTQHRAPVFMPD